MGASNNAPQQNQAAQQQIIQGWQKAMEAYMQWQQANPFPLNNAAPPAAGPQFGANPPPPGQNFGGMSGALNNTLSSGKKKESK